MDGRFGFGCFVLDTRERRLLRQGEPVALNARYLDALALMVREPGALIAKDRFMDEVWRGVPVTDEALTQCIRTLRRLLGDDAARPSFIETVPKHGYRFVAPVAQQDAAPDDAAPVARPERTERIGPGRMQDFLMIGGAGTLGGAAAGFLGGLGYGFDATAQPLAPGLGAISVVLVLLALTVAVAALGAAGVAFGIAAARALWRRSPVTAIIGGAMGGLVIGALVKLLGLDAFTLLFGRTPGDITGGPEGLLLGGAVGMGAWLAIWRRGPRGRLRGIGLAALAGAAAGMAIPLLGGRMWAGSLDLVARQFPGSRLSFGQIGRLFGESEFGLMSQIVTGALEGALFAGCIVGAMLWVCARAAKTGPGG